MSRKRWTVLLVRDDRDGVRQYSVHPKWVRRAAVAGVVLAVVVVAAAVHLAIGGDAKLRAERMETQNRLLTAELEAMRGQVEQLESRVATLSEKSSRFRTLVGLEPIPTEVLEVGIGGPGTATPGANPLGETDEELGEAAFAVGYDLDALDRRARLLSESLGEATDSLMSHQDLLESTPSILPTAGQLSSHFSRSRYHPIHHRPMPHEGVDIAAEAGTPILAAAKGRVVEAEWKSGHGLMVEIDHGYGFRTRYGHASELLVQEGQEVQRGDVIAQVGGTGLATAPNLHYEVLVDGRPTDPLNYVISDALP